ncbi:RIP metalloprotease RseP [Clostridium thermarum]|uniref:RIP metalloprotease RseP n=1 Tax=Clostridium thermarum TaxID=1716543 RepID=UPI00193EDE67|nr:RIP metalloprotease RseP [Clostridium thermarum]
MQVYILLAILAFSILIIGHEFGHFIVAKLNNVKVEEFSLGMGPKIFGIKGKETEYLIKALPIGGYVKMLGEEDKSDDPRAFSNKSSLRKLSIVSAGPIMNILIAILLFGITGYARGVVTTEIKSVLNDSPAQKAGIMADDKILTINNKKINTWDEISTEIIKNGSKELVVEVQRGKDIISFNMVPVLNEETKNYMIGIEPKTKKPSLGQSISYGFNETVTLTKETFKFFGTLFQGKAKASDFGGPITIIKVSTSAAKAGITSLLFLTAYLSIQLAIFNVLPFPALDGGWIFLFLFEIITRKKADDKKVAVVNYIGFIFLMLLMVLVLLKDIFYPINF